MKHERGLFQSVDITASVWGRDIQISCFPNITRKHLSTKKCTNIFLTIVPRLPKGFPSFVRLSPS